MNWLQRISQKWGLDQLEDMITQALQLHPIADSHYKGRFLPTNEEDTRVEHNHPRADNRRTYVNSMGDIFRSIYL